MSYATFMQNLIDNSNMSLDELANKLDMTTVAIRKILADNVKNPSMQTIHKLAEILEVQPIDIAQQILCTIPTEKNEGGPACGNNHFWYSHRSGIYSGPPSGSRQAIRRCRHCRGTRSSSCFGHRSQ